MCGVKKLSDSCFRREVDGRVEVESAITNKRSLYRLDCRTKTGALMKGINVQGRKQTEWITKGGIGWWKISIK